MCTENSRSNESLHWVQRTIKALLINGKAKRTAETYAREIGIFVRWLGRSPETATEGDLERFILFRRNECQLSGSSMRILCVGMKFFFSYVLSRNWQVLDLMKAKSERKLPVVIPPQEVWRIIESTPAIQNHTYFMTIYTCGLRLSEGLNLTIYDIRDGRLLHVRHGKGGLDRYVPLPKQTYLALRKYYATHRNPKLIFPKLGRDRKQAPTATKPMDVKTVQHALARTLKRVNLTTPGIRIHTLRHCYATHLLEQGVNVHSIQRYLGHKNLETTLIYFHLTRYTDEQNHKLLDDFMRPAKHENSKSNKKEVK